MVPGTFAAEITGRFGEAGRRWLAALPGLLAKVCVAWGLELDPTPPRHGVWGVVYAVRGAVRLLRVDPERHALLLERLDAETTLERVEIGEALDTAGRLLRRLAVPAPDDVPSLVDVARREAEGLAARWERLGRPLPGRVIEDARALTAALLPQTGRLLVNWDLHWGNVLRGKREPWLAIDPQVLAGDLEYGLAQLLWWRLEDIETARGLPWALDVLTGAAGLGPQRARAWTYVRTVNYWLMALEGGFTVDPPRCERVVDALDRLL